jgi:hypothetical protein
VPQPRGEDCYERRAPNVIYVYQTYLPPEFYAELAGEAELYAMLDQVPPFLANLYEPMRVLAERTSASVLLAGNDVPVLLTNPRSLGVDRFTLLLFCTRHNRHEGQLLIDTVLVEPERGLAVLVTHPTTLAFGSTSDPQLVARMDYS